MHRAVDNARGKCSLGHARCQEPLAAGGTAPRTQGDNRIHRAIVAAQRGVRLAHTQSVDSGVPCLAIRVTYAPRIGTVGRRSQPTERDLGAHGPGGEGAGCARPGWGTRGVRTGTPGASPMPRSPHIQDRLASPGVGLARRSPWGIRPRGLVRQNRQLVRLLAWVGHSELAAGLVHDVHHLESRGVGHHSRLEAAFADASRHFGHLVLPAQLDAL